MISENGVIDRETLQRRLMARARPLCGHIAKRIPSKLRGIITPEDVLQEVWISAFRRRRSFREDSTEAFDRWLTTLVDRKLLDTIRLAQTLKRGGREAVIQDAIRSESNQRAQLADVASPVRTPSRIISSKEAAWAVKLALEALPDDYRVAIRMHVMDGRSYAEVAEALRLPATAVRYLLRDGLRQLQRRLGSATKFFTDAGKSRQART